MNQTLNSKKKLKFLVPFLKFFFSLANFFFFSIFFIVEYSSFAQDSVTYLHTVKRGLNSDSGGIVVARLAGMPIRAIKVAEELRTKFINR